MEIPQIDWIKFGSYVTKHLFIQFRKKELVKLIGVSRWTLYRAQCMKNLSTQNYLAICAFLEIDPYKFYYGRKPHKFKDGE